MRTDIPSMLPRRLRAPAPGPWEWPAVAGLAVLVGCLFPGALFLGRTFYFRDIHLQWYGQIESVVRTVGAGAWPLWDLYTSFGQPLLANANSQLFYPPTWLNLIVPPWTYFTIYVVAHCLFSGMGLYAFCRRLGVSRGGAWMAAAVWTASGPLLSLVNLWNHFAGAAWIPWVMLAADRALVRGRALDAILCGLCLAAQILCGSPDMFALTGCLVAAYALRFVRGRDPGANLGLLRAGLVAAGVAFGVSAAQWIPSLDLVRQSVRSSLPEDIRAAWSLHPANLIQMVVPVAWDDPAIADRRGALFEGREPLLASIYLGMPAVGLVAAAFARRPARAAVFFALAAAASVVMALGYHSPAYELAMRVLPPLTMLRYPSKAIVVAALGFAVLAGQGFDSWSETERGRLRDFRLRVLGPLVAGMGLGIGVATFLGAGTFVGVVLSAGLAAGVAVLALKPQGGRRVAVVAAALVVADLVMANRGLNPTAPRDFFKFRPPVLGAVAQDDGRRLYVYDYAALPGLSRRHLGRDAPYRMFLPPGTPKWAEAWGMRAYLAGPFAGGHGVYGSYSEDILRIHPRPLALLTEALIRADGTPLQLRLLRMGAVSDVIARHDPGLDGLASAASFPDLFPEPVRLFRVRDPLPRAYAVSGARVADGPPALAAIADPAFDPAREVVLSEGSPAPIRPAFSGNARIVSLRPDEIRVESDLSEPGYVVVVDAYGPGWRATVDGEDVPVLRANMAFRAVPVGAGRHVVSQVYRPRSVAVGLTVSGATLLAVLLAAGALGRIPVGVRPTLDRSPVPR